MPYQLILIDLHMPGMDGFELVEHLQRLPGFVPPAIMMLTSGGQRGDIARCAELGISVHLLKPVRPSELQDAIRQAVGIPPVEAAPATQPDSAPARGLTPSLRVLLAEDNAVNRKVVTRLLEKRGHQVLVTTNGKEALAALEKDTFDLVLMDVQMPEMDGFEATRMIRLSEQGTGVSSTDYRPYRPCNERGSGEMPGSRYGRLSYETVRLLLHWTRFSKAA